MVLIQPGNKQAIAIALFCALWFNFALPAHAQPAMHIQWHDLPAFPQPVAGQFAGISDEALVVAGGGFFPVSLFAGGQKRWVDDVFVLTPGDSAWRHAGKLPWPRGYGAAVSTPQGIVCIGGSDSGRHYRTVFRLRWQHESIQIDSLPDLPAPCANLAAAQLGNTIYIAGGQETPSATRAMRNFWSLDLTDPEAGWQKLEPWPGPARILAVAAAQDGAFYLFSGAELIRRDGKTTRRFLRDAYRYRPGHGWRRLADLPRPAVAAPALAYGVSHIFIFGGDDGRDFFRAFELKDRHPGFRHDVLAYHTITNTWAVVDSMPVSLVTTQAVSWQGSIAIPSGEDRPGHRSARVLAGTVVAERGSFGGADYLAILIYFALLLGMGVYFSGREKTTRDFFLAGQRIPWWAAGLSILGTQLSAITFLAAPAKTYAENWVYFLVNMTILAVAPVVVHYYLPFFRRLQITSAYEYLEQRFNVAVRLFGSIAFILFQLGRIGIVLFLPAIALAATTGINVYVAILAMGLLSTLYTVLGGMEAVVWTDVSQVIILIGGALLSLVIILLDIDGGAGAMFSTGLAEGKFHMFNWTWDWTTDAVWVVVVGNIFANLIPYTSDQAVVQRYLTTPSEKQAAKAIWTNALLTLPVTILFFALGTALYVFYQNHPAQLDPTIQTDAILPLFIVQELPRGLGGLVVAGIFAASMSSLDSSLNSISAVVITDGYRRFARRVREVTALRLARWLTFGFGVLGTAIAVAMAASGVKSLLDLFREILGLFGGSLAGLFMLGIFTQRANGRGALTGAVASAAVLYFVKAHTGMHFFLYAFVGVSTCVAVGYVASLFFAGTENELAGRSGVDESG